MTTDLITLRKEQNEAEELADDLGIVTRSLTDKELTRFGYSFERQFVAGVSLTFLQDIYLRHRKECILGAIIAKEQMDADVDGEIPASNKIGGPLPILAPWLGVGDSWEDINGIYSGTQDAWTTGSCEDWIHSGTYLMGGLDGSAVRIGGNAVHIIFGLGSLHSSPKVETVQFTIDGKQKPCLYPWWAQRQAPGYTQRVKEFDSCFVLRKDTVFKAELYISRAFGGASALQEDYPMLYGVSYIREPAVRLQDVDGTALGVAGNLIGNRYDVVHTT